jgi:uncharacterized membrane protein
MLSICEAQHKKTEDKKMMNSVNGVNDLGVGMMSTGMMWGMGLICLLLVLLLVLGLGALIKYLFFDNQRK